MNISNNNSLSKARNLRRGTGPDEVSPEFPQRRQTAPGPDDVFDPDQQGRGHSDYGTAHYYDNGNSRGGGGSSVLF